MSILTAITKKIRRGNTRKGLLLACASICGSVFYMPGYAQTNGPLTLSAPTTGNYSSNVSISLATGFSSSLFSGTIQSIDCIPLITSPTTSQNFIMVTVPRISGYTAATQLTSQGTCQVTQNIQYMDGIGRPIQTVQVKASPFGNDVVQPMAYDAFGREVTKYLPYAITTGASDGSFKTDALTPGAGQAQFYTIPPVGVTPISTPQAVSSLEASPLSRPLEQGAPGDPWQLTGTVNASGIAAGHTVKMVYTANNSITFTTDSVNSMKVAKYTVTINSDQSRTLTPAGFYTANQLDVTIIKDENWQSGRAGTTEEYKDKLGHVVLKRVYNYTAGLVQQLSTYYVYDDMDDLAFVLPPASGGDLAASISQTMLDNLCYQYRFDTRSRLSQKKLPGKGWEYMVYNSLDQVVLTQDANQRLNNQWTVAKYDALGRPIMSGLWNAGSVIPMATLQASIYAASQWDLRDYTNNTTGYNITSYPTITTILGINYYDDYNNLPGVPAVYAAPSGYNAAPAGMPTAAKTAVLNTPADMLWTVIYYDGLGRAIKTYKQHYLGGTANTNNYDAVVNTYDFTNAPTTVTRQHFTSASTTTPLVTIANTWLYDHAGRKLKSWEQITNGTTATTKTLLSKVDYNEVGQTITKHLHSTDSVTFLQNIAYNYNERGWLLGSSAPLFSMQLQYNTGTNKQYNGNIAYQYWQTPSLSDSYTYTYDKVNRLIGGISGDNYQESGITYDPMGNIMSLNRYQASTLIDQLTYAYSGTNQVQNIADASGNASGLVNGTTTYGYDGNGNLLSNANTTNATQNKSFTYNLLNLPLVATSTLAVATFTYDATGNKLRKSSVTGGVTTTIDYISGIQYKSSTTAIDFIQTEEGRATPNGSTAYDYEYYLGDNLGDTRVTFGTKTGATAVYQTDDYYPFGLEISRGSTVSPKNEYLYNKKELQEELGQYDYGARFYDPVVGRWNVVDKKADDPTQIDLSPYAYVGNNPITRTDPDGNCPWCIIAIEALVDAYETYSGGALLTTAAAGTGAIILHHASNSSHGVTRTDYNYDSQSVQNSQSTPDKKAETKQEDQHIEIGVSKSKHPEAHQHLEDAIKNGVNNKGVIDRANANKRRKEKTQGTNTQTGKDRDEVPPAVMDNGDGSSSVRLIDQSDNRGAGASIGNQIRNLPNGTKIKIVPTN